MSSDYEIISQQSKRAAAHITKFNYHLTHTIPDLFPQPQKSLPSAPTLQTKKGMRGMTFHFLQHTSEGVAMLDAEAILVSARKIYVGSDSLKISNTSYKRSKTMKIPFMPIYGHYQQVIEFYIVDNNQQQPSTASQFSSRRSKNNICNPKQVQMEVSTVKVGKKIQPNNYELYVIHHCHYEKNAQQGHMKWQNFIQRYHFRQQTEEEQAKHVIDYQIIFSYQEDQSLLSYVSSRDKLYEMVIHELLAQKHGELQNINLFQGYLLQSKERVTKKLQELNDPAFDQSQKKWLKLSPEYYKMFALLVKHAHHEHQQLFKEETHHSDLALNSLVYRYMIAKQYNYKECQDLITEYLKWEKKLSSDYNLLMFQKFHGLDFFTYLGTDYEGRAVVLNKASHLLVDNIDSVEDYCTYYTYFLQVYVPRRLRGYAEQFTVLCDLHELCSDNYKFAITKQNVNDGLKYCPERQYKMIVFHVSSFASTLWRIIKHLLPKRSLSKINIMGEDKDEILEYLNAEMDASVIPQYLGGNNKRTYQDDLRDEEEWLKQRQ